VVEAKVLIGLTTLKGSVWEVDERYDFMHTTLSTELGFDGDTDIVENIDIVEI
jgi:hypothetical protein